MHYQVPRPKDSLRYVKLPVISKPWYSLTYESFVVGLIYSDAFCDGLRNKICYGDLGGALAANGGIALLSYPQLRRMYYSPLPFAITPAYLPLRMAARTSYFVEIQSIPTTNITNA